MANDDKESDRGAVLQIEIDLERWLAAENCMARHVRENPSTGAVETQMARLKYIARTAMADTIANGGTFVLVCDGKTVTMVQRPKETL